MGNHDSDQPASSTPENDEQQPSQPGSFSLSQEPVTHGEAEAEVHKYEAAPQEYMQPAEPQQAPEFENLGELPSTYSEDHVFLIARDPRWLFCYWDFDWMRVPRTEMRHGLVQFFLRISNEAGVEETTVEIQPDARNWYVPVGKPDTTYFAEIGYFSKQGEWMPLVRSGPARAPADQLANEDGVSFATVPMQLSFQRMVELVEEQMASGESLLGAVGRITGEGRQLAFGGGSAPGWTDQQRALLAALLGHSLVDRIGLGSEEIDRLLRKHLQERLHSESASALSVEFLEQAVTGPSSLFSGASFGLGASWSAQPFSARRDRSFFMHVNAEIIFYGGTHPDATVWIDGKKIALSADGAFRYHFTLPDGDFSIPVVAESPDKVEQRSATLSFTRGTARVGDVGSTGQPAELDPLIGKK